jgi:hypothetical protein
MSSVTLPPLPSARAKEIERRQQQSVAPTAVVQSELKLSPQTESIVETTLESDVTEPPSQEDISKVRRNRSNELQSLHQKEQKILGNQSPLDTNLLCEALHQYICTTSNFLNTYVADVNVSLEGADHKLRVLENQLSLLEGRLASIPGLLEEDELGDANMKENEGTAEENESSKD